MKAAGRIGIASVVLGVVLSVSSRAHADESKARGVFERDSVEVQAPEGLSFGDVRIDNQLGNVSVRGHDHPTIAIQSFKRADDESTLSRLVVALVPDGQGRVSISTSLRAGVENRPVRSGSIAVDLVVFVPRDSTVRAEIWNGRLQVSEIDKGATLTADEGSIEVRQVSGVVASDLRLGDQAFVELFGELYASAVDGALKLETIQGNALEASTVRGRISGTGLKTRAMKVRSVHGDVDLSAAFALGGRYSISSLKGNVSIRFHSSPSLALEILAHKAMIASDLSPSAQSETRWRANFGSRDEGAIPAQLQVRAPAGTVLVRHF